MAIKVTLSIIFILLSYTQVQAESINRSNLKQNFRRTLNSPIFAAPKPPKRTGEPGRRSGSGSRGCRMGVNKLSNVKNRITAIVPFYPKSESVYGVTTAKYPTFWFYVPYSSNITYGEFVLEDEAYNQAIYRVSLTGTPGIVSLRLPSTAKPLEVGKQQRWYFNIYCNDDKQIISNLEGYVKREELKPALKKQLEKATPRERVTLYGAHGIWYEALSDAVQLRRINPQDSSWQKLLQEIGLNNLANKPIVDCCKLEVE